MNKIPYQYYLQASPQAKEVIDSFPTTEKGWFVLRLKIETDKGSERIAVCGPFATKEEAKKLNRALKAIPHHSANDLFAGYRNLFVSNSDFHPDGPPNYDDLHERVHRLGVVTVEDVHGKHFVERQDFSYINSKQELEAYVDASRKNQK